MQIVAHLRRSCARTAALERACRCRQSCEACEHSRVPVTFIRHGIWDVTEGPTVQGSLGRPPLSRAGVAEAEAAGRALSMGPPRLILSSPMTRALQTAMIISWVVDRRVT